MSHQSSARLIAFHDDGADLLQIFIHGYEGVRGAPDLRRLTAQIGAARPAGCCYLLCWGGWLARGEQGTALDRLANVAANVADEAVAGRSEAWLEGISVAAGEALRFWSHAGQAEQTGQQLWRLLEGIQCRAKLNLWGHSLGGRVLLSALSGRQWSHPVQQAVLMGAAVESDPAAWQQATRHTQRLINIYSTSDLVLRVAPLWTPLAGLRPVLCDQVDNYEVPFHHHQYWPRLSETVARCVPEWKASNCYRGPVAVECDRCHAELEMSPGQQGSCRRCGARWILDDNGED